ncbi:hypothetical protein FHW12_000330 [Dokdonella fugitiva]|uniref:Uncharacterized protein n=1 Tax=Dokdonella fugitiva TaxID=328517 RepID=A0A839EWP9_9GAMM|nr:hypothetical protein [Dokdonella fugitiva]
MKRNLLWESIRAAILFPRQPMLACTWRFDERGRMWATPL